MSMHVSAHGFLSGAASAKLVFVFPVFILKLGYIWIPMSCQVFVPLWLYSLPNMFQLCLVLPSTCSSPPVLDRLLSIPAVTILVSFFVCDPVFTLWSLNIVLWFGTLALMGFLVLTSDWLKVSDKMILCCLPFLQNRHFSTWYLSVCHKT